MMMQKTLASQKRRGFSITNVSRSVIEHLKRKFLFNYFWNTTEAVVPLVVSYNGVTS